MVDIDKAPEDVFYPCYSILLVVNVKVSVPIITVLYCMCICVWLCECMF